ncbi:hypothetical protein GCM10009860_14200 [Microbacterium mitrae]|uniref:Uncharacterized protein n=1 Tax=Microbacterium mitrae TaxID=664640 RepID=A0A5C8HNJ4_9MICO|nr:hypothetical protein [Microbacterium mitrae]TXK03483.1 hypothetical protein FVP60_11430 [Microbacterium mitrae]
MTRDERWARGPLHPEILTGTISPQWVAEFKQTPYAPTNATAWWALGAFFFLGFGGLIVGGALSRGHASANGLGAGVVMGLVGALLAGLVAWYTYRMRFDQAMRLWAFARANDLTYVGRHTDKYNGMLFDVGGGRLHTSVLRTNTVRPVEFGNYQYTTGSGKSQQTHHWGYVAVRLENLLPHIVLDAEGNNGFFGSNLPIRIDRDQHLSLEGDFDRYFRLYCPQGYERDALYLFTPDVMVRFIDNAAELDVEIIDDWVYFYAKNPLVGLDPRMWAWLYSVVDSFLVKVDQWERWRDDRLRLEAEQYGAGYGGAAGGGYGAGAGGLAGGDFSGGQVSDPGYAPAPFAGSVPPAAAYQPNVGAAMGMTVAQAAHMVPPGTRPPNNPYLGPKGVAMGGRRLRRGVPWASVIVIATMIICWIFFQTMILR